MLWYLIMLSEHMTEMVHPWIPAFLDAKAHSDKVLLLGELLSFLNFSSSISLSLLTRFLVNNACSLCPYGTVQSKAFTCVLQMHAHRDTLSSLCLDLLYKQNLASVLPPGYKIIKKMQNSTLSYLQRAEHSWSQIMKTVTSCSPTGL